MKLTRSLTVILILSSIVVGIGSLVQWNSEPQCDDLILSHENSSINSSAGNVLPEASPLRFERLPSQNPPAPIGNIELRETLIALTTRPPRSTSPSPARQSSHNVPTLITDRMQQVVTRDDVLRERDGVFAMNARGYRATLHPQWIAFARPFELEGIGQPTIVYQFEELRQQDYVIGQQAVTPQAKLDEREIHYRRGMITERYKLGRDEVEQDIILNELPPNQGDIVVTGKIETNLVPPPEGTNGSTLMFTHKGQTIITIDRAVAIDGSGTKLPLDLVYSGGKISITVPWEWARSASLPITIDPVIGGPIVIDATTNPSYSLGTGISYNSQDNTWLAVWTDTLGAGSDVNVYGQKLDATAQPVGPVINIAVTTGTETAPSASYAGAPYNRWLVLWANWPSGATEPQLEGKVVNADGTFFTSTFVVDTRPDHESGGLAAFDGSNWYACWVNSVGGTTNHKVYGRFISPTGALGTTVDPKPTPSGTNPQLDLAFGNGLYMATWLDGSSVMARTITPAGVLSPTTQTVETSSPTQPRISGGQGKFLIIWLQSASGFLEGRFVNADLSMPTPKFTINGFYCTTPLLTYSQSILKWYVIYGKIIPGAEELFGRLVTDSGQAETEEQLTSGGFQTEGDKQTPSVAWNSAANEAVLLYIDADVSTDVLYALRISLGTPPSAPTGLAAIGQDTQVALSWNASAGATSYVVKRNLVSGGPYSTITTVALLL